MPKRLTLKKEASPRVVAAVVLATLFVILALYWRGLLTQPPGGPGGAMGGGGGMPPPPPAGLESVEVNTVAGGRVPGWSDGPAKSARLNGPAGLAVDAAGNVAFSDTRNHRVRCLTPAGEVRTLAGSGPTDTVEGGYQDGPADAARFRNPAGLAFGAGGALFVADAGNHCIRRLGRDGKVATAAGAPGPADAAGLPSGGYADGPARQARLAFPTAVVADAAGGLVVADTGNDCIRRILPDGRVTTLAGRPGGGYADGPGASARFRSPTALARAADGTLFVADTGNRCLRAVAADGSVRTLATPRLEPPAAGAAWSAPSAPPGGQPAPAGIRLLQPVSVAVDARGRLLVTDAYVHCLFQADPRAGTLLLLAGVYDEHGTAGESDGNGSQAHFSLPSALACAAGDVLYAADFGGNRIRRVQLPR